MTQDRAKIVAEARSWLGTPYIHQASCRGAGTDCLGLIRGVWRGLYHSSEPAQVPAYTQDWGEPEAIEQLWQAANFYLTPVAKEVAVQAGQVLLFRMRRQGVAKHLGIVTQEDPARFIHAYSHKAVHENALSQPWARRIVARFDFPGFGDF